jgi:hypothetical protein
MACECAPVIAAEMRDWVALGGGNSGCCGNAAHTYGFHCAANRVPASDYSRRRDPAGANGVVNWNYACAGDFSHGGKAHLRARHAQLLARLEANDPALSMICEFIGQPFANKPVYYWFRGDGLKKYTGSGHTHWSHIAWWRSRVNQRANLWTPGGATPAPAPVPVAKDAPRYPGYVLGYNPNKVDSNVRTWQARMKARGWSLSVDGVFGPGTLSVVKKFQAEKNLGVDGLIGERTWNAAWSAPVT